MMQSMKGLKILFVLFLFNSCNNSEIKSADKKVKDTIEWMDTYIEKNEVGSYDSLFIPREAIWNEQAGKYDTVKLKDEAIKSLENKIKVNH